MNNRACNRATARAGNRCWGGGYFFFRRFLRSRRFLEPIFLRRLGLLM
jgi:hypothetical protein